MHVLSFAVICLFLSLSIAACSSGEGGGGAEVGADCIEACGSVPDNGAPDVPDVAEAAPDGSDSAPDDVSVDLPEVDAEILDPEALEVDPDFDMDASKGAFLAQLGRMA